MIKSKIKWRWTLFNKTFLILLASFCFMNLFNIFLDYQIALQAERDKLNDRYLEQRVNQIAYDFPEKYGELSEEFYNEIDQTFLNEPYHTDKVFITDLSNDSIYDLSRKNETVLSILTSKSDNQGYYEDVEYDKVPIEFDMGLIGKDVVSSFEDELRKNFKGESIEIAISSKKYEDKESYIEDGVIKLDDLCYLAMNQNVMFDERKEDSKVYSVYLCKYFSPDLYVYLERYDPMSNKNNYIMDFKEHRDKVKSRVDSIAKSYSYYKDEYTYLPGGSTITKDGTLYQIYYAPLYKKGAVPNEEGEYSAKDTIGILVSYNYKYEVVDQVMYNATIAKSGYYFISLFMAIIISIISSYVLSRRIKRINESTRLISNHQFDVYINDKSEDELGTLSQNINHMSQQLKKTIDKLNEEIERVRQLESVRQEFIANFTHEIKTPLSIINGYIELISEIEDEDQKQKYLEAIEQETNKINELVLAMLNLSRLESGHVHLDIQEIDLEDLISTTIDSFSALLEKKNIKVIMNGEDTLINADVFQMQIVLKNFISNAIKHTPDNRKIYISYNHQMFSIENEGSYIEEDVLKTIWDTYVSSDREGTGLGLAICRTILDMHDFKYDVKNTGRGVCFSVYMKADKE